MWWAGFDKFEQLDTGAEGGTRFFFSPGRQDRYILSKYGILKVCDIYLFSFSEEEGFELKEAPAGLVMFLKK